MKNHVRMAHINQVLISQQDQYEEIKESLPSSIADNPFEQPGGGDEESCLKEAWQKAQFLNRFSIPHVPQ